MTGNISRMKQLLQPGGNLIWKNDRETKEARKLGKTTKRNVKNKEQIKTPHS